MATYYIDPINGNDSNNGTSTATPWKWPSKCSNTTYARGDTVLVAKCPVYNMGINATFTYGSTITLASAVTTIIDDCESGWTASTDVTVAYSATGAKSGTNLIQITPAAAFTTGKLAYKNLGSTVDLSGYQQISLWFAASNNALLATDLTINLCSDTTGDTVVASRNISAETLAGNQSPNGTFAVRWCPLVLNFGTNLPSNVQSISITANRDFGSLTIYMDHIIACKAASSNDALTLWSLIGMANSVGSGTGDGSEPWYPIQRINGTTVTLAAHAGQNANGATTQSRGYCGTTQTVAAYRLETFKVNVPAGDRQTASQGSFGQWNTGSGSGTNYFYGGWDFATDVQNGTSIFDFLNGGGNDNGVSYIPTHQSNGSVYSTGLGGARALYGIGTQGGRYQNSDVTIDIFVGCNNGWHFGTSSGTDFYPSATAKVKHLCNNHTGINPNGRGGTVIVENLVSAVGHTGSVISLSPSGCVYRGGTAKNNIIGVYALGHTYIYDVNFVTNATDISISSANNLNGGDVFASNCTFSVVTFGYPGMRLMSANHNNTAGYHRIYTQQGIGYNDPTQDKHASTGNGWKFTVSTNPGLAAAQTVMTLGTYYLVANQLVTFTAWAKRASSSMTTGIQLWSLGRNMRGSGFPSDADFIYSTPVSVTDTWQQVTVSITPTKDCLVELRHYAYGTTGDIWIDDLTVTGLPTQTAIRSMDTFGPQGVVTMTARNNEIVCLG